MPVVNRSGFVYLPAWLYELKPVAYAATATFGLTQSSLQPLGSLSASLLWLAVARMLYMRVRFRHEHRGHYWHQSEPRNRIRKRIGGVGAPASQ